MTGRELCKLMRLHSCDAYELKRRTGFTLKRIREVRKCGLTVGNAIRDWKQAVTGVDPGPQMDVVVPPQKRQYRKLVCRA